MKKNSAKKSLIASLIILCISFSMLVGTTYAWFTDTVTSGSNVIASGNLDVELYHANAQETTNQTVGGSTTLFPLDAEWEPGAIVYEKFTVANKGNLALKYLFTLNVTDATAVDDAAGNEVSFAEMLKVAVITDENFDYSRESILSITDWKSLATYNCPVEGKLEASADEDPTTDTFGIVIYWEPSANDNLFNTDDDVTVSFYVDLFATQYASESDSIDDSYDENAPLYRVSSEEELVEAIAAGGNIVLVDDVVITAPITVGNDTVIELAGKTLDASALVNERPFHLAGDEVTFSINATDSTVVLGQYGLVNVPGTVKKADVTIVGGTYTGNMTDGALVRIRQGSEEVDITIDDVTFIDAANNGFIVSANGFAGTGTLTVNGGSFSTKFGFDLWNLNTTIRNATIDVQGVPVEAGKGSVVVVDNCTLSSNNVQVGGSVPTGVAASNGGKATVKNCTISGTMNAVYHVYNSNGTIEVIGGDFTGATYTREYQVDYVDGSITVDGQPVA